MNRTLAEAFDALLALHPEMQALQRAYAAYVRGLSSEEQMRWIAKNTPQSLLEEFDAKELEAIGISGPQAIHYFLYVALETWTQTGSPHVMHQLLNPEPQVVEMAGAKMILLTVSGVSDLNLAIVRLKAAFLREFPSVRPRTETLERMERLLDLKLQGYRLSEIAWEFVCEKYGADPLPRRTRNEPPDIRELREMRSSQFAKEFRREYASVRKLATRELDTVTQLIDSTSQKAQ